MNEELMEQIRGAKSDQEKKAILEKAVSDLTQAIQSNKNIKIDNLDVINARLHKEITPLTKEVKGIGEELKALSANSLQGLENLPQWALYILKEYLKNKAETRAKEFEEMNDFGKTVVKETLPELVNILKDKIVLTPPEVNVEAPVVNVPEVNIPAPIVNIPETSINIDLDRVIEALSPLKLITDKANAPISVKLSDGKEFVRLANMLDKVAKSVKETNKQVVAYSSGPSEVDISETSRNAIAQERGYSTIGDGRQVVTNAGTRVQLSSSSVPCKKVVITGEDDNAGVVVVGGPTVVAAQSTRRGTPLVALQSDVFFVDNLNKLYIDATVNTEGVTYVYYN